MSIGRRAWFMFGVVLVITLAFDQGSKAWARTLPLHEPQAFVPGYWDWELAHNPGAAFSSFVGGTGTQILLGLIAVVALIAIGVIASRTRPEQRLERFALALVAGGALGNLVDRIRDGAVTDFIAWRWHEHRWPIFNVADAVLLVGAVLLLVASVRERTRPRASRPAT